MHIAWDKVQRGAADLEEAHRPAAIGTAVSASCKLACVTAGVLLASPLERLHDENPSGLDNSLDRLDSGRLILASLIESYIDAGQHQPTPLADSITASCMLEPRDTCCCSIGTVQKTGQ